MGQVFHGAVGLRGRTVPEVGRALHRSAVDLGWAPHPDGELHLAVVDVGESVWVTSASEVLVLLAGRLARSLDRPVRLYTVVIELRQELAVRCAGRTMHPDGRSDPLAGTVDDEVVPASDEPLLALAEERLRMLLEVHEDIDHVDRAHSSHRFAAIAVA